MLLACICRFPRLLRSSSAAWSAGQWTGSCAHVQRTRTLTEEEIVAESDRSPGVLMASGYIAGGAIAGILIAFTAGVLSNFDKNITDWATLHNPLFDGRWSDFLSLIPFAALVYALYLVGKEKRLAG